MIQNHTAKSLNFAQLDQNSQFLLYRSARGNANHRTEPVVAVVVAVVVVEVEHAGIARVVVVAPANEERIVRVREVRVVTA